VLIRSPDHTLPMEEPKGKKLEENELIPVIDLEEDYTTAKYQNESSSSQRIPNKRKRCVNFWLAASFT